jgi:hypothetical protein
VLRSHWRKPRRMHPTFMRGNLIVWAIEIKVARDPELNPGNHIRMHHLGPCISFHRGMYMFLFEAFRFRHNCAENGPQDLKMG